jgi:hypothetical protein
MAKTGDVGGFCFDVLAVYFEPFIESAAQVFKDRKQCPVGSFNWR